MSDLEKIFLGTMLVSGLLILGLFGLYFDIGDMVAGTFAGARPTFSQDMDLIRERRRASYERETQVRRAPRNLASSPAARPSSEVDFSRVILNRPPPSRGELVDREVRRLQRRGYVDDEYLRMRALYQIDKALIPVIDQYDQLIANEDYEEAIRILLEARAGLDEANLLGQRDLVTYLYQAYILGGKDGEANQTLLELTNLKERIVAVEERAELHRDEGGRKYVKDLHKGLGQLRESIQAMQSDPETSKMVQTMARGALLDGTLEVPTEQLAQNLKAQILNKPEYSAKEFRFLLDRIQAAPPGDN